MSKHEISDVNPFQWQDDNDSRYAAQQERIVNLEQKVNFLMETVTILMRIYGEILVDGKKTGAE